MFEVIKYFHDFETKNLDGVSEILSDNVQLIDWNLDLVGKETVLNAVSDIFSNFEKIKIDINRMTMDKSCCMAEITILLDNLQLKVVDVLEFEKNKIISIRAYKQ